MIPKINIHTPKVDAFPPLGVNDKPSTVGVYCFKIMRTAWNKLTVTPGQKFGRLTVIEESCTIKDHRHFICLCDCGKTKTLALTSLRRGFTQSCGCYRDTWAKDNLTKHGMSYTRIYRIYAHMKERCTNQNCKDYKNYGDRGISICPEWIDFKSFYDWAISNGYKENLTIDRIDNNKGYCPDNCQWTTRTQQGRNKRNNVSITIDGKTQCVGAWADEMGLSYNVAERKLKKLCS